MDSNINYSLAFKISEVKDIFKVDKKIILDILYYYPEFFNLDAKNKKNSDKIFDLNDIRTIAYALTFWEENPDFENIRYGLNANGQYEDYINEIIDEITPLFLEPNDFNIEKVGESVLVGGLTDFSDKFLLAVSYRKSADELVKLAKELDDKMELLCPAIFCYRHSIELFMKAVINKKIIGHNLKTLYTAFEKIIKEKFNQQIPLWFKNTILALNDFDSSSTTFRYGDDINNDEYLLDLDHLRNRMLLMENTFIIIKKQL